jgi:hypothetical protein
MNMRAYKGKFVKKDGTLREMTFIKFEDLPKAFLDDKIKGNGKSNVREGSELVWDLDTSGFRVFNFENAIGNLKQLEVEEKLLINQA